MIPLTNVDLKQKLQHLYNDYRDALYNKKYYGCRLDQCRKWNMGLEILLAVGTSSAIGGWAIFKEETGVKIWALLSALSTLIAVLKPIINVPEKIERYTKLYTGHGSVHFDLEQIVRKIQETKTLTAEMLAARDNAIARRKDLDPLDDLVPNKQFAERCYVEVNAEIPTNALWLP